MGNSSGKEARNSSEQPSPADNNRSPTSPTFSFGLNPPAGDRNNLYSSSRSRNARHETSLFNFGGNEQDIDPNGPRRETRQEKEARRAEKERRHRRQERERSLKEEGVDGGYLVTLGTYVGPEDFSKAVVRQLQIERRLAPFWRGLNDHSTSWTEHQLVASARGLPLPAPDEIPAQEGSPTVSGASQPNQDTAFRTLIPTKHSNNTASNNTLAGGSIPSESASNRAQQGSPTSLFMSRTKSTPSLGATRDPLENITPQETRLPHQPMINGQPVEAYLYKDAAECPICFLYYPPFLNRTRCCDQYICSECFVQIKRPDPHIPEHAEPSNAQESEVPQAFREALQEEEALVSEPATCPFCVSPELGVTYDAPPFRRGLVHANRDTFSFQDTHQASSKPQRQRGVSLSATSPLVVTTDQVRPDWSRKLSEARSYAARRSAAATALHTAAYNMNGFAGSSSGLLGRRRRTLMMGPDGQPGFLRPDGGLHPAHMEQLMAALETQAELRSQGRGQLQDLIPSRGSSRAQSTPRVDDLEEIMMMEAIRMSLATEEDRKKKEDRENAKEAKKDEKKRAKEQKKFDKAARKNSSYNSSANTSQFFDSATDGPGQESDPAGKGKARANLSDQPSRLTAVGFNPMNEPTSTVNSQPTSRNDSQKYLEKSRANLSSDLLPVPGTKDGDNGPSPSRSYASSAHSSVAETPQGSSKADEKTTDSGNDSPTDQPFNFGSLGQIISGQDLVVDSSGRLHASKENSRAQASRDEVR